jgi:hypothetical protein
MLKIRVDVTQNVVIKSAAWNELGPDLAFLRLPYSVMAGIEKLASVVDGMRHRANALAGEPEANLRGSALESAVRRHCSAGKKRAARRWILSRLYK